MLIVIMLLFAAPCLMLPFCLFLINKRNVYTLYLPAVFLSCWSALIPPIGDQYRYYTIFDFSKEYSIKDFISSDFELNLVTALCFIFSKLNLNLELLRAAFVIIAYVITISIFRKLVDRHKTTQADYILLYYVAILSVPYISIGYGFRFGLAIVFFSSGLYFLFFESKNTTGIALLVLSAITHFSFFIYIPFIFLFRFFKKCYQSKTVYLTTLLSVLILKQPLLSYSEHFFQKSPFLYEKYVAYFYSDSYWALGYLEELNWRGIVLPWIEVSASFLFLIIYFKKINQFKYNYMILALYLLATLCLNLPNMCIRILSISIPLGAIFSIYLFLNKKMTRKCIVVVFLFLLLFQVSGHWKKRRLIDSEKMVDALILPLPCILMNTYDRAYLIHKITDDGNYFYNIEY